MKNWKDKLQHKLVKHILGFTRSEPFLSTNFSR